MFLKTLPSPLLPVSKVAMAVSLTLTVTACGESTSSVQGAQFAQTSGNNNVATTFNQSLLLESLTDNVIVPTYDLFHQQALTHQSSVATYCSSVASENAQQADLKLEAQQSWRDVMATWQMAEVMQIGPLLENGASLRNKIYSWPNTSSCAVDQDVVLSEDANYDISSRTTSRRGLDALEYLLFNDNLDHSCTTFGTEPKGWNNRTDLERTLARCQFAMKVSDDLVVNSANLLEAWQGTENIEGYADVLKQAGQPGSAFLDAHSAINDVSDAMFYIDTLTKDAKLATPLGIFANDCGLSPCVENVESPYANNSLDNVINNIRGINQLFLGGTSDENTGFDDYLVDVGDADTALRMRSDLTAVTTFAQSIEQTMSELLEQDPDKVEQVHDQLKAVTDTLKTDFIQSLALELPATSAGDND